MPEDDFSVEVEGLEEFQRKMEQVVQDIRGRPMRLAIRDCVLMIQAKAKKNLKAWEGPGTGGVDTGRLRASITPEVRDTADGIQGVVGSNLSYAPYQELGTRPHWVSVENIGTWAKRHGLGERAVYVSGTPLRFLQRAIEDSGLKVRRIIEETVEDIVEK